MKKTFPLFLGSIIILSGFSPPVSIIAETVTTDSSLKKTTEYKTGTEQNEDSQSYSPLNSEALSQQDEIPQINLNSTMSSLTGTWGTTNWSFDSTTGTFTISAGTLENAKASPWYGDSTITRDSIKKIVFSGDVIAPVDCSSLFANLTNLTSIEGLTKLDTSTATNMSAMFSADSSLLEIDTSNFDTSNVTDMSSMFNSTYEVSAYRLNSFNTSSVTDMSFMFEGIGATSLDLSMFNTSSVSNMSSMFRETENLVDLNLKSFDTSNVTTMTRMFADSFALTDLDLSNFNTGSVTSMDSMFQDSDSLINLNLSSFNTSSVTTMASMFKGCDALESLTLGDTFKFVGDASLGVPVAVGGTGTGNWIKEDKTSKGYSPTDFMANYGTNDLTAGKYIAEIIGVAVNTKNSILYVGDSWSAADNFVSATDQYGNPVDLSQITVSGQPDLTQPGSYEVTYTYNGVSSTATITVKENKLALNVHDSTIYVGDTWNAEDNFDSAFNKDGNPADFSEITAEGSVDTTKVGNYDVTYSYLGLKQKATITVISPLKLSVPTSVDFGKYKLGTSTTILSWNKASKVEVEGASNTKWDLSIAITSSSNFKNYLKIGEQSISDQPVEVIGGAGPMNISDEVPSDQFIRVDYTGVKAIEQNSGTLEWTLTPSISEVTE